VNIKTAHFSIGDITVFTLNICSRWREVVNLTHQRGFDPEKSVRYIYPIGTAGVPEPVWMLRRRKIHLLLLGIKLWSSTAQGLTYSKCRLSHPVSQGFS